MKHLKIHDSLNHLSTSGGDFIFEQIKKAIEQNGTATVFLNGGSTPIMCFDYLSALFQKEARILEKTHWFIGDERWVTVDNPESNEFQIREHLFKNLAQAKIHLYSWKALETTQLDCARNYDMLLTSHFTEKNRTPDLVLLGMGDDGHTASLFPGSQALLPDQSLKPLSPELEFNARAIFIKAKNTWRLSLTPRFINKAKAVLFLIAGENKKHPLQKLLDSDPAIPGSWIKAENTSYFITKEVGPDNLDALIDNKELKLF
ncbi:MAG: 6-phosphogluconolactonase [Spirochaetales bacterium]|nr:6-phosphogluconolactonase [Spirochaetales bacterium]